MPKFLAVFPPGTDDDEMADAVERRIRRAGLERTGDMWHDHHSIRPGEAYGSFEVEIVRCEVQLPANGNGHKAATVEEWPPFIPEVED